MKQDLAFRKFVALAPIDPGTFECTLAALAVDETTRSVGLFPAPSPVSPSFTDFFSWGGSQKISRRRILLDAGSFLWQGSTGDPHKAQLYQQYHKAQGQQYRFEHDEIHLWIRLDVRSFYSFLSFDSNVLFGIGSCHKNEIKKERQKTHQLIIE